MAYISLDLDNRPSLQLQIEGKTFQGIMDTGADKSIVSSIPLKVFLSICNCKVGRLSKSKDM